MSGPPTHPLIAAVRPLLDRVGGALVTPDALVDDDVPLVWNGVTVAGVRLPSEEAPSGLDRLLADLAAEFGTPLRELARSQKQQAVRLLEERGAFTYRKSAEGVADALGVTRFTVYNYLNRSRE